MTLGDENLQAVEERHLKALVDASVPEGRTIEYKSALPGRSESDGKEFLADVCSFANASGGDILYGVEENGGVAATIPGVDVADPDEEVLRLENMLRSGLDPRLVGLRVRYIPLSSGGYIFVVRVPRSFNRPHAVDYKGRFRFYSRGAAGKFGMDVAEIRSSVLGSESLAERVRSFRAERLAGVAADEGPLPLGGRGIVISHVLPLSAFDPPALQVDLEKADREHWDLLEPGALTGDRPRYNFDGLLRPATLGDAAPQAYAQLFRSGAIEAADAWALADREKDTSDTIPSVAFERYLVRAVAGHLALQEKLGVDPPVVVMLSLVRVRGYRMTVSVRGIEGGASIDRDDLLVPEVLFEEYVTGQQEVAQHLRPAFDAVWNACGYPRSLNYDESGQWRGNSR